MGKPLTFSTTDTLMLIIWACAIVLGVLLTILILRAVIKSAVLGALRQRDRERAAAPRTSRAERVERVETQTIAPRGDPYPYAPGMAAFAAATEAQAAAPEPDTTAFTPEPDTTAFTPKKPDAD